jgi:hypothetical protein
MTNIRNTLKRKAPPASAHHTAPFVRNVRPIQMANSTVHPQIQQHYENFNSMTMPLEYTDNSNFWRQAQNNQYSHLSNRPLNFDAVGMLENHAISEQYLNHNTHNPLESRPSSPETIGTLDSFGTLESNFIPLGTEIIDLSHTNAISMPARYKDDLDNSADIQQNYFPQEISVNTRNVYPKNHAFIPQNNLPYPQLEEKDIEKIKYHIKRVKYHHKILKDYLQKISLPPQTYAQHPQTYAQHPQTYAQHPQTYAQHPQTYAQHPQTYAQHPQQNESDNRKLEFLTSIVLQNLLTKKM